MKYQLIKIIIIGLLLIQFACESNQESATSEQESIISTTIMEMDSVIEEGEVGAIPIQNTIEDFVPEGYRMIGEAVGSLNGDDQEDAILVVQSEATADKERVVILLVRNEKGNYEKVVENSQAILCQDCGGLLGDPFQRVVIKDDYFTIEHFGGSSDRWARYSTFKYDSETGKWKWHKDATVLTSAHDLEMKETVKQETDECVFGRFDIER
jgi:hypothetical protein